MHKITWGLALSALAVLLWAAAATQAQDGDDDILFADDFNDPDSGWRVPDTETHIVAYADEALRVALLPGSGWIGVPLEPDAVAWDTVTDLSVAVDVTPLAGTGYAGIALVPADGAGSIVFQVQPATSGYRLLRRAGDAWEPLIPWQRHAAIRRAMPVRLGVAIAGADLRLVANGAELALVEGAGFAVGGIELAVAPPDAAVPGAEDADTPPAFSFDNFVLARGALDFGLAAGVCLVQPAHTDVNLRAGPGLDYAVLMTLRQDRAVRATGSNGEWLLVQTDSGIQGWLHRGVVTPTGDCDALPPVAAPPPPEPGEPPPFEDHDPPPARPQATAARDDLR